MTSKKSTNKQPTPSQQAQPAREPQEPQMRRQPHAEEISGKEGATKELETSGLEEPLANERVVVPLAEESLQVDKRWVEAGVLEVRKRVTTRPERVSVELAHEEVDIERVPVNRALDYGQDAGPRQEGDTLIIPVIEEEVVVTKRRILREEVRIRKRQVVAQRQISENVLSEELDIRPTGDIQVLGEQP